MRQIKTDIERLVYDEFGDELNAKDREIEKKDKEINKLTKYKNESKTQLKKLNNLKDLNSPEAKQIIQSLMSL